MQFEAAGPGLELFAQRIGQGGIALAQKAKVHGQGVCGGQHAFKMPGAGRAGGGICARGRARAAAQHGGNTAGKGFFHLLRADKVDVRIHAASGEQAALARNDFCAGANDHVHIWLHIGVARLADGGNAPVAYAQIGLDDAQRRIHDDGIGDDRVHGSVGIADLALAHAVANDLAAAKADFVAVNGVVAFNLDPQLRIGKADAVARGGAVKFGILASGNADHAFSSLGALASSGPMI